MRSFHLQRVGVVFLGTLIHLGVPSVARTQPELETRPFGTGLFPDPIVSLAVGNLYSFYSYSRYHGGFESSGFFAERIIGDTSVGAKSYAIIRRYSLENNSTLARYYRRTADSTLYEYSPSLGSEYIVLNYGDSVNTTYPNTGRIIERRYESVFGDSQLVIRLVSDGSVYSSYATKFGYLGYSWSSGVGISSRTLKGAIIEGIGYGNLAVTPVDDSLDQSLPQTHSLLQNYPNPFNAVTIIRYHISNHDRVRVLIYDMLANLVATLVDEYQEPGQHEVEFDASSYPSGIYFYRLATSRAAISHKLILLK